MSPVEANSNNPDGDEAQGLPEKSRTPGRVALLAAAILAAVGGVISAWPSTVKGPESSGPAPTDISQEQAKASAKKIITSLEKRASEGALTAEEAERECERAEAALQSAGLSWQSLGLPEKNALITALMAEDEAAEAGFSLYELAKDFGYSGNSSQTEQSQGKPSGHSDEELYEIAKHFGYRNGPTTE